MPSRGLVLDRDRLEARSARCAVITVTKNAVFTVTSGDVGSKETNMTITSTEGARVIFAFVGADAREPMTVRGRLADAAEREPTNLAAAPDGPSNRTRDFRPSFTSYPTCSGARNPVANFKLGYSLNSYIMGACTVDCENGACLSSFPHLAPRSRRVQIQSNLKHTRLVRLQAFRPASIALRRRRFQVSMSGDGRHWWVQSIGPLAPGLSLAKTLTPNAANNADSSWIANV